MNMRPNGEVGGGFPRQYRIAGPEASKANSLISWTTVWKVFRRWWKVAIPIGLLLAAASASALVMTFVPVYEAMAWVRVEPDQHLYPQGRLRVQDTQLQLIRTPMVMEKVKTDSRVNLLPEFRKQRDQDQVPWLTSHVGVRSVGTSNLFNVTFTARDPETAATLANVITEAYFGLHDEEGQQRTEQLLTFLNAERDRLSQEVLRQSEIIRTASGEDPRYGLVDELSPVNVAGMLEQNIIRQGYQLEMQRAQLRTLEAFDQRGDEVEVPKQLIQRELQQHPLYNKVRRNRDLMVAYREASAQGERSPRYLELKASVEEDEATLEQYRLDLPDLLRDSYIAGQKAEIERLREQIDSAEFELETRMRDYHDKLREVFADDSQRLETELNRAELRWHEEMLNMIGEEIFRMRSNLRFGAGTPTLLRPAEAPRRPVTPLPYAQMGMAAIVCLVVPFVLAFGWEQFFKRVSTTSELAETSLPVLGEVASLPLARRSRMASQDLSLFRESVDILSTSILLSESLQDVQVLLITSATNGEGKTMISCQTALSIAVSSHKPTLLIDADMRRPDVHHIFEISKSPGLSDVLERRVSLDDAIVSHESWDENFHILPAGRLRSSPRRLVGNGELSALFEELRQRYAYIVIDTAPVLAAAETLVFARNADAAVLSTMRDVSRMDQIRAACQRMEAAGRRPAGAILNGVPTSSYRYYYGSYDYSFSPDDVQESAL